MHIAFQCGTGPIARDDQRCACNEFWHPGSRADGAAPTPNQSFGKRQRQGEDGRRRGRTPGRLRTSRIERSPSRATPACDGRPSRPRAQLEEETWLMYQNGGTQSPSKVCRRGRNVSMGPIFYTTKSGNGSNAKPVVRSRDCHDLWRLYLVCSKNVHRRTRFACPRGVNYSCGKELCTRGLFWTRSISPIDGRPIYSGLSSTLDGCFYYSREGGWLSVTCHSAQHALPSPPGTLRARAPPSS